MRPGALPPSPADAVFSVSLVPPAILEDSQRLDSALASIPGVSLFRRTSSLGANPTVQGIALRGIAGSGSSRALVTLDGIPRNDPFGGWVIWTAMPPETIGEAQVVRGAGSGPYGAGALTGVVALSDKVLAGGDWSLDADMGTLDQVRAVGQAAIDDSVGVLTLTGAAEKSDGWIPVRAGRGAADRALTLTDGEIGARYVIQAGPVETAVRGGLYAETRGAGLVGAGSTASGFDLGVSTARTPSASAAGWTGEIWVLGSNLRNTSVSVATDRSTATLSNDQYRTPALGYGARLAVRGLTALGSWEVGTDIRGASGESLEYFHPVAGRLTYQREAGGETLTGGVYGEVTEQSGPLLLVAAGRMDGWGTFDGRRLEWDRTTGAARLALRPPARGGVVPTGRVGLRWAISDSTYLRTAAYAGFRPATLNELFRPFRVGNDITEANAALTPEKLYGGEMGAGTRAGPFSVDLTGFYNQVDDAILNVTLRHGPFVDPVAGFVPADGVLRQRQNVGAVQAYGIEASAATSFSGPLGVQAAFSYTHARVDGGGATPQLDGLIPAGTPALVATGELIWRASPRIRLTADLRYESARFDDDQNLRRLNSAATVGLRMDYGVGPGATVFIAADNILDAAVATAQTAAGIISYGPPRVLMIGVSLSGKPHA